MIKLRGVTVFLTFVFLLYIFICGIWLAHTYKLHLLCQYVCVYVCTVWETSYFFVKKSANKITMRKSAKIWVCSSSVVCCSSQGPVTFLFSHSSCNSKRLLVFILIFKILWRWTVFQIVTMAFEMGSVPKDPIDVRHFSLFVSIFSSYYCLYRFMYSFIH